jgi:phosphate-selective porin OprO and OprP
MPPQPAKLLASAGLCITLLGLPGPTFALPQADDAQPSVAAPGLSIEDNSEQALTWKFTWRGWNGLAMELVQKTPLESTLPLVRLDEVRLAGTLGGKLEVDGAAFRTDGGLSGFDDGVQLRRARIRLAGDAILGVPFRYKVEFGYIPNQFNVNSFYVAIPDLEPVGELKIGQFSPAMGLDLLTSSWDITMMEPAASLQALGPKTSPGLQIGRLYLDGRATWAVGAYSSAGGTGEYGTVLENMTSAIGRLTWLAIDDIDADAPTRNRFVHLGLSGSRERSGNGDLRLRARPESYIAPYVIDTGTIASDNAYTVAAELLWVDAGFALQAEAMRASVLPTGAQRLTFAGGYVMGSWSLTGESRGYDRGTATLARVRPSRDFTFGPQGGWGSIEAALRYSYTDLDSGSIHGGRLSMLMAGLDWTFRPQLQWLLDVGVGSVRGGTANGNMLILQTRLGLNF